MQRRASGDPLAVQEGAVAAAEILDVKSVPLADDLGVAAGDHVRIELDLALRRPAENGHLTVQRVGNRIPLLQQHQRRHGLARSGRNFACFRALDSMSPQVREPEAGAATASQRSRTRADVAESVFNSDSCPFR